MIVLASIAQLAQSLRLITGLILVRIEMLAPYASVAELVDARDLKSLELWLVWVRLPSLAPKIYRI